MTEHNNTRRAALAMLKSGAANLSEVARLAGTDRQLVRYWANAAGIDWRKIRDDKIAKLWAQAKRSS